MNALRTAFVKWLLGLLTGFETYLQRLLRVDNSDALQDASKNLPSVPQHWQEYAEAPQPPKHWLERLRASAPEFAKTIETRHQPKQPSFKAPFPAKAPQEASSIPMLRIKRGEVLPLESHEPSEKPAPKLSKAQRPVYSEMQELGVIRTKADGEKGRLRKAELPEKPNPHALETLRAKAESQPESSKPLPRLRKIEAYENAPEAKQDKPMPETQLPAAKFRQQQDLSWSEREASSTEDILMKRQSPHQGANLEEVSRESKAIQNPISPERASRQASALHFAENHRPESEALEMDEGKWPALDSHFQEEADSSEKHYRDYSRSDDVKREQRGENRWSV
jgi:hypothetical protein